MKNACLARDLPGYKEYMQKVRFPPDPRHLVKLDKKESYG